MNQDKREDIIYTAMELIAMQGFHSAPMAMIAEKAKVAVGTIYCYFRSKDNLIHATYSCLEERMTASIMEHYSERWPIPERYHHICRELVNFFLLMPMEFRFIEQFYNSPYGVTSRCERINDNKDIISRIFEEGQQQQIIKNLPSPVLKALTFGPLIDICRNHILRYFELDVPTITGTVEACWDAIRL